MFIHNNLAGIHDQLETKLPQVSLTKVNKNTNLVYLTENCVSPASFK